MVANFNVILADYNKITSAEGALKNRRVIFLKSAVSFYFGLMIGLLYISIKK
jgi:hypothetical protein